MLELSKVKIGQKAIIKKINANENIKRRLLDIGLTPGTEIECSLSSPSGNPKAYFIRGTLIAIRNEDTNNIIVEGC